MDQWKLAIRDQKIKCESKLTSANWIQREKFTEFAKLKDTTLIKVITGIRRCGKSTLAIQAFQGETFIYINFDDDRLSNVQLSDLQKLLEQALEIYPETKNIVLDEIQNIDRWELFVNRLHRDDYNVIITGSNSKLLSQELASHLTGRHLVIELYPFSFGEFLSFRQIQLDTLDFSTEQTSKIKKIFQEYWDLGGFPDVASGVPADYYLRELYNQILTKDIMVRRKLRKPKVLQEIALHLHSLCSRRFTFQSVTRAFDLKGINSVKNYLGYLEESYLLRSLQPFSFKSKERIGKAKKIYSIDLGLLRAVDPTATDFGHNLENLVHAELIRRNKKIYFLHERDYECDFVVMNGRQIESLVQVCYSLKNEETKKRELRALIKAAQNLRCDQLMILTWDEEEKLDYKGYEINVVPVWKWLLNTTQ